MRPDLWRTVGFRKDSTVLIVNKSAEIAARGHLITAQAFSPLVNGGLLIRGRWEVLQADDYIQILTPAMAFRPIQTAKTKTGVEFFAGSGKLAIQTRRNYVSDELKMAPANLAFPGTYDFEITDNGKKVGFTFDKSQVGQRFEDAFKDNGPARLPIAELSCEVPYRVPVPALGPLAFEPTASNSTRNLVVFHNRDGGRKARLKQITISALAPVIVNTIPISSIAGSAQQPVSQRRAVKKRRNWVKCCALQQKLVPILVDMGHLPAFARRLARESRGDLHAISDRIIKAKIDIAQERAEERLTLLSRLRYPDSAPTTTLAELEGVTSASPTTLPLDFLTAKLLQSGSGNCRLRRTHGLPSEFAAT